MMQKLYGVAFALGLVFVFITTPVYAVSLGFSPASQGVVQGNPVSMVLAVSGLGDMIAPSLSTFDVDITFDTSILSFIGAVFGDPSLGDQLDLTGIGGNPTFAGFMGPPGVLNVFEDSFDTPDDLNDFQADSFTLATLTFTALAQGQSALSLAVNTLGDANGDPFATAPDIGLPAEVTVTPVPPAAVPEPGTIALFSTGIFVLLGYAYYRRQAV